MDRDAACNYNFVYPTKHVFCNEGPTYKCLMVLMIEDSRYPQQYSTE